MWINVNLCILMLLQMHLQAPPRFSNEYQWSHPQQGTSYIDYSFCLSLLTLIRNCLRVLPDLNTVWMPSLYIAHPLYLLTEPFLCGCFPLSGGEDSPQIEMYWSLIYLVLQVRTANMNNSIAAHASHHPVIGSQLGWSQGPML